MTQKQQVPIRRLKCSCCAGYTMGRQWHNRDSGWGLCGSCATWISTRETKEYMERTYGVPGVHYNINQQEE